ncbi:SDR family NAD(P)-dependent oxidoreductase [Salinisphaera orenii]|uniref:Dehydrogenase n=1 Tax=Salinisphaera orenii YIM 95161 TaxID=1051139 RepID=A0A423Q338_9GAMM|nr:SDR family NAD(P)-dependent oxidoreductase [Salinisphaera halophila]ROO33050.1 dehydrogenase [Salinisphaera halophila YIM 95161]
MIRIRKSIRVARGVADCYRYLVDFSTSEQWDPAVYRAAKRTPGAPGVGTEFDVTVSLFGRRRELRYRIESLAPGTAIVLCGTGAGMVSEERIELVADGDATTVEYRADFTLTGLLGWSKPAARALVERMTGAALAGLRDALEIDTTPPRQGWRDYIADRSLIAAAPSFTERGYLALDDKAHSEFMDDRVVVVTGATGGIGEAIAAEYARLGATTVIVGRDAQRLAAAATRVRDFAGCAAERVTTVEADLLDLAQTRAAADALVAAHPRIDVLVNNAGALFVERATTADGFERTLAINLVAPFVLTEGLMPALGAARGRVVNMSSGGMYLQPLVLADLNFAEGRFDGTKAYARAKRGLVALTRHWARRYAETGVTFNAMHPGWVATAGVAQSLPGFNRALGRFLRDARMGADTAVWLGASRAAGRINGEFFFDRRPHPTAVLPNTRVRPSEAQQLHGWLRNATGMDGHGVG